MKKYYVATSIAGIIGGIIGFNIMWFWGAIYDALGPCIVRTEMERLWVLVAGMARSLADILGLSLGSFDSATYFVYLAVFFTLIGMTVSAAIFLFVVGICIFLSRRRGGRGQALN